MRSTLKKVAATAGLSGALALGAFGVAGAATPQSSSSNAQLQALCAKAPQRLSKLASTQAKLDKLQPQVTGWVTQVQQDGMPKLAKRMEHLDARLKKRTARITKAQHRIEALCPGATASGG